MKNRFCGPTAVYWYGADAGAITMALAWPSWLLPILTWLFLLVIFLCAGLIPVRQRA